MGRAMSFPGEEIGDIVRHIDTLSHPHAALHGDTEFANIARSSNDRRQSRESNTWSVGEYTVLVLRCKLVDSQSLRLS